MFLALLLHSVVPEELICYLRYVVIDLNQLLISDVFDIGLLDPTVAARFGYVKYLQCMAMGTGYSD